jgi:hypothetical protein
VRFQTIAPQAGVYTVSSIRNGEHTLFIQSKVWWSEVEATKKGEKRGKKE